VSTILWDVCWEYVGGRLDGCDPDRSDEVSSVTEAAEGVRAYCSGAVAWHLSPHREAGEPDLICSDFVWSGRPLGRVRWWVLILVDDAHDGDTRDKVLAALRGTYDESYA
jgi:hypothetical protein